MRRRTRRPDGSVGRVGTPFDHRHRRVLVPPSSAGFGRSGHTTGSIAAGTVVGSPPGRRGGMRCIFRMAGRGEARVRSAVVVDNAGGGRRRRRRASVSIERDPRHAAAAARLNARRAPRRGHGGASWLGGSASVVVVEGPDAPHVAASSRHVRSIVASSASASVYLPLPPIVNVDLFLVDHRSSDGGEGVHFLITLLFCTIVWLHFFFIRARDYTKARKQPIPTPPFQKRTLTPEGKTPTNHNYAITVCRK
mmetsp:Transcript_20170/g.48452  ORF Transcript_20170/g.48452 Transcript_20170/m.48452 type:complete len:251 (+) Transcript_20170:942-1694(+)